jgi:hypothetical protein
MGLFSTILAAVAGATAADAAWADRQNQNGSYQIEYVKDGETHTANVSRLAAGRDRDVPWDATGYTPHSSDVSAPAPSPWPVEKVSGSPWSGYWDTEGRWVD